MSKGLLQNVVIETANVQSPLSLTTSPVYVTALQVSIFLPQERTMQRICEVQNCQTCSALNIQGGLTDYSFYIAGHFNLWRYFGSSGSGALAKFHRNH